MEQEELIGKARRDFAARFGEELLRGGIAMIPNMLFAHRGKLELTPDEVVLICDILSYKWTDKMPFPSLKTLADRAGVNKSSIVRTSQKLARKGLLKKYSRYFPDRGQASSYFDLTPLFDARAKFELPAEEEHPEYEGSHCENP